MDPNATLKELRELVAELQEYRERGNPVNFFTGNAGDDVDRVLELFNALDQWIQRGGFLPEEWRRDPVGQVARRLLGGGIDAVTAPLVDQMRASVANGESFVDAEVGMVFRTLTADEDTSFREYARTHPPTRYSDWQVSHPVVRDEWRKAGHKVGGNG